jgi:hypothetical protein
MGFSVDAKIKGANYTEKQLRAIGRFLPTEIHRALKNTVVTVEAFAKMRAPVGKTNSSDHQTRVSVKGDILTPTVGVVGTNQAAAMAIDQGARPHDIKPRNARALAIPIQDDKGSYESLSRTRNKRGEGRKYRKIKYKDASNAPNKRHLDVKFYFTKRVKHPGKKAQPFLTPAAKFADQVAVREGNKAVDRAIGRGKA